MKSLSSKLQGIYTKKFVLIQGGCDSFCTFCLTVKKRGRHYFRAKEDILEEICDFEKQGGKEVVLTGVNLSAWGLDTTIPSSHSQVPSPPSPLSLEGEGGKVKSRFSELLRYLLDHTTIPRIRISSLGPEFIDDACLEIFKETRIYPHFHYSVQSGSSAVLKSMARHYDGPYIKELLEKTKALKRADGIDVSLGADIIVGFP
ncbi:MAG: radical SAM protein [Candidatus Peribacteria bacterium]|nr:MAG: radical SAM protein [Candidatus Peribacteria bacterium]